MAIKISKTTMVQRMCFPKKLKKLSTIDPKPFTIEAKVANTILSINMIIADFIFYNYKDAL